MGIRIDLPAEDWELSDDLKEDINQLLWLLWLHVPPTMTIGEAEKLATDVLNLISDRTREHCDSREGK